MMEADAQAEKRNDDHGQAPEKSPIVEVIAEDGDQVEPPPPQVVEPDPELTPEEAERARKQYLLTRFWISARGYWGSKGDRLSIPLSVGLLLLIVGTVGLQYGVNVWNRSIFDAIEQRDATTVYYLTAIFFPLAIGSVILGVAQVFFRMSIQRRWRTWPAWRTSWYSRVSVTTPLPSASMSLPWSAPGT